MSIFDNDNKSQEVKVEPSVSSEPVETNAKEVAFISSATKIEGKITTEGCLVLRGEVVGDIKAGGNIEIDGKIDGNVECESFIAGGDASLKDITVTDNIILKANTVTLGNVACKNITVYGKVVGNINASGNVILKSSADVKGDIDAQRLGIEGGAKISGKINIK